MLQPEVLPHYRRPRRIDALDVAAQTIEVFRENGDCRAIAIYLHPNGMVQRVANPAKSYDDVGAGRCVGTYDRRATVEQIADDLMAEW